MKNFYDRKPDAKRAERKPSFSPRPSSDGLARVEAKLDRIIELLEGRSSHEYRPAIREERPRKLDGGTVSRFKPAGKPVDSKKAPFRAAPFRPGRKIAHIGSRRPYEKDNR